MIRTDLASEAHELLRQQLPKDNPMDGIVAKDYNSDGFSVTHVSVETEHGAEQLGKPIGRYVTIELGDLIRREDDAFSRAVQAMASELKKLLPEKRDAGILVAGLGNSRITPDAIGPQAISHIMITRHLRTHMPEAFSAFCSVSAVSAGVLGTTGIETAELIRGVIERTKPDAIIAVDALASRSIHRLCSTIQIADTGIIPGSGIGNSRTAMNRKTMGIPVIAVGVPTVVDAATLAADLLRESGHRETELKNTGNLIVTPREIDDRVAGISKVVGYGINMAIHSGLTISDIELFLA